MIQAVFERIAKHDLTDWAVLLQGVCGVPSLLGRLPTSCVENFATAELEKVAGNNPLLDVIVSLANDSNLPLSELCSQLKNERVSTCRYATSQENMASGCIGRTASKPRLGPALWVDKIV